MWIRGGSRAGKGLTAGSEEHFWHTLSLALGGRTVAEWQAAMSAAEFDRWRQYYLAHPFDDAHRYHRPAALVAAGAGIDIQKSMDYLCPPRLPDGMSADDLATMRALGVALPE